MLRSLLAATPRASFVAVLLVGLVFTTPVVCVCGPGDHGGQALHSLLPHSHEHVASASTYPAEAGPHQHGGVAEQADTAADGRTDGLADDPAPRTARVTAQSGSAAGSLTTAGAIGLAFAQPWLVPQTGGERLPLLTLLAPPTPLFEPPGPPPRQTA
ncbi:MAG: hypothetical protein IT306_13625 [Chloroflexi bacterium]|nr:hypothetical protein [Chloroflexota bacterium]